MKFAFLGVIVIESPINSAFTGKGVGVSVGVNVFVGVSVSAGKGVLAGAKNCSAPQLEIAMLSINIRKPIIAFL